MEAGKQPGLSRHARAHPNSEVQAVAARGGTERRALGAPTLTRRKWPLARAPRREEQSRREGDSRGRSRRDRVSRPHALRGRVRRALAAPRGRERRRRPVGSSQVPDRSNCVRWTRDSTVRNDGRPHRGRRGPGLWPYVTRSRGRRYASGNARSTPPRS
jgi:hypothetical protein